MLSRSWSVLASPRNDSSPGDTGLQLFENAAATAGGLVAIILAVGPVSGAHLNPVVSLAVPCGGLRRDDLVGEAPGELADVALLVGEVVQAHQRVPAAPRHRGASGGPDDAHADERGGAACVARAARSA